MIELRFPAPETRIPGLNDNEHWRVEHARKLLWQQASFYAAKQQKIRCLERCTVTVSLPFKTNRRRDPHNFTLAMKWMIDGLVHAEVWPDDTPEYVVTNEPVCVVGATEVVISLAPMPQAQRDALNVVTWPELP
jgi:hypothetical protein